MTGNSRMDRLLYIRCLRSTALGSVTAADVTCTPRTILVNHNSILFDSSSSSSRSHDPGSMRRSLCQLVPNHDSLKSLWTAGNADKKRDDGCGEKKPASNEVRGESKEE
jgi:hypothetical protein